MQPLVWEYGRSLGKDAADDLPSLVLEGVEEHVGEAACGAR
jgi:hypothetical protein